MYDPDDSNAPYDNVEFPIRKPGTGTWPGPAGGGAGGAGVKLYGHQTTRGAIGGAPKLAPLVEVDGGSENSDRTQQTTQFSNHNSGAGIVIGTSSVSSSTSSLSSSSAKQSARSQFLASTDTSSPASFRETNTGMAGFISISPITTTTTTTNDTTASTTTASSAKSTTTTTSTTASSSSSPVTTSSTTGATNKTSSTSTATSGKERQGSEKSQSKPVITVTNDSNLYMPTEVGDGTKKKTLKQVETEEEDFKRQDLNPASRRALESVYTQHVDFYQLNSKVLDEGSLLKQDVLEIYRKSGETLTYEQLLQGMLVDGERFLLGSCWLYFTHVQFLDLEGTKILREPYGRGRIGLTSKRALFLSTETYTDASLEQFPNGGSKKKPDNGYKLEVSKKSCVTFKNIPLSNFHSAEMEVVTGTAAQTKITKKHGCCSCLGLSWGSKWVSTTPMTRSISSRVVRVGVSMPPWQTRMFMDIHLDPSMSLTVARDFISQLHAFAPHMH